MGDGDPFLFAYDDSAGNTVCYTFTRRPLEALPFARDAGIKGDWYDIITPTYGFGGPLCAEPRAELIQAFRAEFEDAGRERNLCLFVLPPKRPASGVPPPVPPPALAVAKS